MTWTWVTNLLTLDLTLTLMTREWIFSKHMFTCVHSHYCTIFNHTTVLLQEDSDLWVLGTSAEMMNAKVIQLFPCYIRDIRDSYNMQGERIWQRQPKASVFWLVVALLTWCRSPVGNVTLALLILTVPPGSFAATLLCGLSVFFLYREKGCLFS